MGGVGGGLTSKTWGGGQGNMGWPVKHGGGGDQ